MDKTESIAQKLSEATEGLLFGSEGEYPFDVTSLAWAGQRKFLISGSACGIGSPRRYSSSGNGRGYFFPQSSQRGGLAW
ncbi:MAG: hypothetical protein HC852_24125 [Acaryochloridaceae cyanobacterium RU_4_10]|nr:hypothetical protein [Acaryochloridaceae cyanobacterium RU_4_10]